MVVELAVKREREASLQRADSLSTQAREPQRSRAENDTSAVVSKRWTPEQDEALRNAVAELGNRNWMAVAERVPGRDNAQCLQRWNKVLKPGLVKGPWSVEEDALLMDMMLKGYDNWRQVSAHIPGRTAKQCRERWRNRLDPSINKAPFTDEEDTLIQQAYEKLGNRWTQIAELLPGRTEDAVKLRWKTLNPNQKTYTKLGRPRLMPTEALDSPPTSTLSPVRETTTAHAAPAVTPARKQFPQMPNHFGSASVGAPAVGNNNASTGLPEPIVEPLGEEDTDEKMSEEDIMILNAFLRGHSNQSLGDSFKSLQSLPSFGDELDAALQRLDSKTHPLTESILEESDGSKPLPSSTRPAGSRRPPLISMLSIGSSKNMSSSLRSLTADVDPDDRWINGELNRRLSGMSLLEGMTAGSAEFDAAALDSDQQDGLDDSNQDKAVLAEFEQQLDALNDAGSLLGMPLNESKDALPEPTAFEANADLSSNQVVALEELICGDDMTVTGLSVVPDPSATMTAQDFYSEAIPHDELSNVHRFEI